MLDMLNRLDMLNMLDMLDRLGLLERLEFLCLLLNMLSILDKQVNCSVWGGGSISIVSKQSFGACNNRID